MIIETDDMRFEAIGNANGILGGGTGKTIVATHLALPIGSESASNSARKRPSIFRKIPVSG